MMILRNQVFVLAATGLAILAASVSNSPCYARGPQANSQELRILFFTMDGCPPCREMEPGIAQLREAGYPVTVVDARTNRAWAEQFQVSSTPTTILFGNQQILKRHSGLLDARTIADWYNGAIATEAPISATASNLTRNPIQVSRSTEAPGNSAEARALQSTVRLKVADAAGFSHATGTVIHSHGREAVVLTCGHVFREVGDRGVITADIGWGPGQSPCTVPGRLISYDAGPRDVALVLIDAGFEMPAVPVAARGWRVPDKTPVFSIGCDRGADPSIRPSIIKSTSRYDGARKYEIVGRPVEGRSGGGLFTANGHLVGVCNARAEDVDEGIYSALENVWSELAGARIDQLLPGNQAESIVAAHSASPATPANRSLFESEPNGLREPDSSFSNINSPASFTGDSGWGASELRDSELIVVIRDKATGEARTLVIEKPEGDLIQLLADRSSLNAPQWSSAEQAQRLAMLRDSIKPNPSERGIDRTPKILGQSPDDR